MREMEISAHLGHSNRKATEFEISLDRRKSARKTSTLDIRRADSKLLSEAVSKVPWKNVSEGTEIHQC